MRTRRKQKILTFIFLALTHGGYDLIIYAFFQFFPEKSFISPASFFFQTNDIMYSLRAYWIVFLLLALIYTIKSYFIPEKTEEINFFHSIYYTLFIFSFTYFIVPILFYLLHSQPENILQVVRFNDLPISIINKLWLIFGPLAYISRNWTEENRP